MDLRVNQRDRKYLSGRPGGGYWGGVLGGGIGGCDTVSSCDCSSPQYHGRLQSYWYIVENQNLIPYTLKNLVHAIDTC